jgi:microcystin-dependent protein
MSEPFLGEIRMFAGNFAPNGWAFCNGQTLPIAQYSALFSLLGTYYGGDGRTNFALPNLQGQVAVHWGTAPAGGPTYAIGQTGGSANVTLTVAQIPAHSHQTQIGASNQGGTTMDPTNAVPAEINTGTAKSPTVGSLGYSSAPTGQMAASAVTVTGSSQPHPNMQPFLCVSFIIALAGIYPSRS